VISQEEMKSEYLVAWFNMKEENIEKEILNCILRNNLDSSVFKIYFIKKLEMHQIKEIEGHSMKVEIVCDGDACRFVKTKRVKVAEQSEDEAYLGHIIAKMLIKESNKPNFLSKYLFKVSLIISFFHSLLPFLLRFYEFGTFFSDTILDNVVIACLFISDLLFYFVNTLFLLLGCIAFSRKIKILCHLSNLIAPKTVEYYRQKKIFPTLNFFNKVITYC
jgi:hypothetical protein